MVRVLVIGYAPDAVDFTDPTMPPGLDAAIASEGIAKDVATMRERGWDAEHLPIRPDETLHQTIANRLAADTFDCIVIGAGVRLSTRHVAEFEAVLAVIRQSAPDTPIAFNSGPTTSGDAAARWVRNL